MIWSVSLHSAFLCGGRWLGVSAFRQRLAVADWWSAVGVSAFRCERTNEPSAARSQTRRIRETLLDIPLRSCPFCRRDAVHPHQHEVLVFNRFFIVFHAVIIYLSYWHSLISSFVQKCYFHHRIHNRWVEMWWNDTSHNPPAEKQLLTCISVCLTKLS